MELELKNIKHYASMSEETYCYEAVLYRDGKRVGRVSNRGTGGCDDHYFDNHSDWVEIDAWCKANLPKETYSWEGEDHEFEVDLESWCHQRVSEHIMQKDMNRALRKLVTLTPEEQIATWNVKWSEVTPERLERFKTSHPGHIVLNCLAREEVSAIWKEHLYV